jgi:hypothetical protein
MIGKEVRYYFEFQGNREFTSLSGSITIMSLCTVRRSQFSYRNLIFLWLKSDLPRILQIQCIPHLFPTIHPKCSISFMNVHLIIMIEFLCHKHPMISQPFYRMRRRVFGLNGSIRGVEASFSTTTGNKTLEFGRVSSSNDMTQYKMESFCFYLI